MEHITKALYFDAAVNANKLTVTEVAFEKSALNAVRYLRKNAFRKLKVLRLKDIPIVHGKLVRDELLTGLNLEELYILPRYVKSNF